MIEWLKQNLIFIVGALIIGVFLFFMKEDDEPLDLDPVVANSTVVEDEGSELESSTEDVLVDIKGEINNPGVYELKYDARVNDVIELADGFTKKANESDVNLAQKVHDEMIIIVSSTEVDSSSESSNQTTSNQTDKININYATQEEVETLTGIGPSKAQAIIDHRDENGLFTTVEDLLNISGIGEKTLENIKEDIQIP